MSAPLAAVEVQLRKPTDLVFMPFRFLIGEGVLACTTRICVDAFGDDAKTKVGRVLLFRLVEGVGEIEDDDTINLFTSDMSKRLKNAAWKASDTDAGAYFVARYFAPGTCTYRAIRYGRSRRPRSPCTHPLPTSFLLPCRYWRRGGWR